MEYNERGDVSETSPCHSPIPPPSRPARTCHRWHRTSRSVLAPGFLSLARKPCTGYFVLPWMAAVANGTTRDASGVRVYAWSVAFEYTGVEATTSPKMLVTRSRYTPPGKRISVGLVTPQIIQHGRRPDRILLGRINAAYPFERDRAGDCGRSENRPVCRRIEVGTPQNRSRCTRRYGAAQLSVALVDRKL